MKIGIDTQAVTGQLTGLGTYTKHLIAAFIGQTDIPAAFTKPPFEFHFYSDVRYGTNTPSRIYWENFVLPRRIKKDGLQLLHVPAFAPALFPRTKTVVTAHDLIGMLFPNQIGLASRFYWGRWLPAALSRAAALIADSESTRRDLIEHLRIPERKISVIYPSGHEGFTASISADAIAQVTARHGLCGPYFLFVGTIEPRKNLARVIGALARLKKSGKAGAAKLVVVGSKQFAHGAFFKSLGEAMRGAMDEIIFTGYVTHSELNSLYCGAAALVYPSLYEGFGIPILEALGSGCPVITANVSSTPEVAGEAALLVDPLDEGQIASAMERMLSEESLRQKLKQAGAEQIKKFSWAKTAQQTLQVYETLLT